MEKAIAANPGQPLPPKVRTNLHYAVTALSSRSNLTPESRLALSRTELILGNTNEAARIASAAVAANTNLLRTIDPRLRLLVRPVSR